MTWWGVVLIGLGCFYFGYILGALMRGAKIADDLSVEMFEDLKEKEE